MNQLDSYVLNKIYLRASLLNHALIKLDIQGTSSRQHLHTRLYTHLYTFIYTCLYTRLYTYLYTCLYTCLYTRCTRLTHITHTYAHAYTYVHTQSVHMSIHPSGTSGGSGPAVGSTMLMPAPAAVAAILPHYISYGTLAIPH